jgi:hypothetical protein
MDWVAVATLVVAAATALLAYVSLLAARTASRQLSRDMRPVVVPSKPDDHTRRNRFGDGTLVPQSDEIIYTEIRDDSSYLGICLRNIGTGIAVVRGLKLCLAGEEERQPGPSEFAFTEKAIYMAPADTAYLTNLAQRTNEEWFGPALLKGIADHLNMSVHFLYTDMTNSQPSITRMELHYDPGLDTFYPAELRHWMVKQRDWKRVRTRFDI